MGLFDRLRSQLEQAIARGTVPPTPREEAAATEQHLIDLRVGLDDLRRAYAATERELATECEQLAAAERRGQLAEGIQDAETTRLRVAKEAVNAAYEMSLTEALAHERRLFYLLFASEDQKEGVAAFMEKRTPDFKGR